MSLRDKKSNLVQGPWNDKLKHLVIGSSPPPFPELSLPLPLLHVHSPTQLLSNWNEQSVNDFWAGSRPKWDQACCWDRGGAACRHAFQPALLMLRSEERLRAQCRLSQTRGRGGWGLPFMTGVSLLCQLTVGYTLSGGSRWSPAIAP